MKKVISIISLGLLAAASASAHVIVTPKSVGVATRQVFTVSVPAEKNVPTTALKLMLPDGLEFVTPTVQAGWQVKVVTQATGKTITDDDGMQVPEMKPVEIDWTGGSIPAGDRDEFTFQAQVPATPTTLDWKAYQTYSDGSVVNWDQDPNVSTSENPYSTTTIVNDLTNSQPAPTTPKNSSLDDVAIALSIVAVCIAAYAIAKKSKTV